MPAKTATFDDFLRDIDTRFEGPIRALHDLLSAAGCTVKLQQAKSGHVVSFNHPATGLVVANLVSRKKGPMVRIYANGIADYPEAIDTLPEPLRAAVKKAPICRRLHDPTKCLSTCAMGYIFDLDGETHMKCRYNAFLLPVDEASLPAITEMLRLELRSRAA